MAHTGQRRGRGGRRTGTPGVAYTNRTDLNTNRQPVTATPSKEYGQRAAQEQAQRMIPLPQMAPPPALNAPTARPQEPITAGVPIGPGPGAEALSAPVGLDPDSDLEAQLRALRFMYPNSDITRLLAEFRA